MSIIKKAVFSMVLFFSFFVFFNFSVLSKEKTEIYLFTGQGCPHCALVDQYFKNDDIYSKYPVVRKEIYFSRDNAVFFNKVMDNLDVPSNQRGVPAVVMGKKILVGDRPIIQDFKKEADLFLKKSVAGQEKQKKTTQKYDLTILAVIGASIVDAINPCAFAVLIILMSTILVAGNGKKAFLAGLFFSFSIFISYFLMGLGLYKALEVGKMSSVFFKVVGYLAVLLGLANVKDYFWYGKGFLMEVPLSWRPKLKNLLGSVTSPIGAFGIGFLVSLFLLPCTSGPYIVILGMLAQKTRTFQAVSYLLLYNLIFVLPMLIISFAVYKGFDPKKAESVRLKQLKTLHLIAGLVLLVMGSAIIAGWI